MRYRLLLLSRREMIAWLGAAAAVACSSSPSPPPQGGFFTDAERRALGALANAVLPPDGGAGGEALGAVPFIERLLTALDGLGPGEAPRLMAGGPFSGRQPFPDGTVPPNDFATWLEVDRVTLASWRLALYGSAGVGGGPNDAIVGVVIGLREVVENGLADAMKGSPAPLETLDQAGIVDAFRNLDRDFRDALIDLVCQAAFGAPEYGGNPGLAGWKLTHFEGDSQPLGFSIYDEAAGKYRERPEAPMTGPNPGPDPDPLDDDVRSFLTTVVQAAGGKVFS